MIKPIQINSEGVWRGSQPEGVADWNILRDLGIKRILCLQTGCPIFRDGDPEAEKKIAVSYGMQFMHVPMGEILPPTKSELNLTLMAITLDPELPIFIHCRAGEDRTGMTSANLQIKVNGKDRTSAIKEMYTLGMHFWYWWWAWFL